METLLGMVGATVLGSAGWWVGDHIGLMTAFTFSMIGTGFGMYAGRRLAREYLG
jgi:hypothetical protein